MIISMTKFHKNEQLSIIEYVNFFETYFKNTKEYNRLVHAIMHSNLISDIFMNKFEIIGCLLNRYGNDEKKLEKFDEYINPDTNSGVKFIHNFSMIYGIADYEEFIKKLKEEYNFDTTILDNYICKLSDSEDYTKLSFLFAILSKAKFENTEDSIIKLSYSDYLLPSLKVGKILDLENTRINFEKLFLLNENDLEFLLDNIYEASFMYDENGNSLDSIKHFIEKEKNNIILEQQNEKDLAMKKYKQQLHENHFYQIYNLEFPDGYNVIIYYNQIIDAFIEDIECNGKSLVMLNDGKDAINYHKDSKWKKADLYLFSFDDIISIINDIKSYLSSTNGENIDVISLCDVYLNKYTSIQSDYDRNEFLQQLLCDIDKFENLKENEFLSLLLEKSFKMCNILSVYYSKKSQNSLTPTESVIQRNLQNNTIIDFPLTDITSILPFGYYASLLDKIYGADFVPFDNIRNYFPGCDEHGEHISILYNAVRFINNAIMENDFVKRIASLDEYYDETVTLMKPIYFDRKQNNIEKFKK